MTKLSVIGWGEFWGFFWWKSLSRVHLFGIPWTAAHHASLSMEFSRQEYWSGQPFLSFGDLPDPESEPKVPALPADCLPSELSGKTFYFFQFSSVQSLSRVRLFATHELQHARPPYPSPTPGVHSNSRPSSQWCHPAISSSVVPFSSCPQSLPASESFPMSQLFVWGGQIQVNQEYSKNQYKHWRVTVSLDKCSQTILPYNLFWSPVHM